MDQLTDIFEQVFSHQVQENIAEGVTRIVEDVIDVASNNIDEVCCALLLLFFEHNLIG